MREAYQEAHNNYLTYTTVSSNALEREVLKVFEDADKFNIQIPSGLSHSHGGQTTSKSQHQGADVQRGKDATAAYKKLKQAVQAARNNVPSQPIVSAPAKKTPTRRATSQEMVRHSTTKAANKKRIAIRKRIAHLQSNPTAYSQQEIARLEATLKSM